MKFDKDTLIKQRFWLLLALSVPLAVVGLFVLSSSVPAKIGVERKKSVDMLKNIDKIKTPKSDKWVEQAAKKAAEKKEQEKIVWEKAALEQSNLMTWPKSVEAKYHFRDGDFAKEIIVTRKKDEQNADPSAGPKDDANHFHGVIKDRNPDWILVKGKKDQRFEKVEGVRVKISAETELDNQPFSSLAIGDRVDITFEKGKYFGDKLTENERTDYARDYKKQLPEIISQVLPVNDKGEGVVQFPGWVSNGEELPPRGSRFFRYVADDWKQDLDFSDEAWMAQEDLWVQQEIYRLVRVANDSVARFKGQGGSEKEKDYDFTNPYWHLKCRVTADGKLKVVTRNLQDQRQYLDVTFLMKLTPDGRPVPVKIEGVARAPAGTPNTKDGIGDTKEDTLDESKLGGVRPKGIFGIEQVLTWKTAAVKRIDNISLGTSALAAPDDCAESHRQCSVVLKPLRPEQKKEEATRNPAMPPGGQARPIGPGSNAPAANLTPNGLVPDRYLDATREARRMPVGVVLIVDQQHVERVQAAFVTSKLRFLTTQVILNRYPQSVRPPEAEQSATIPGGAPAQRTNRPMLLPGGYARGGVVGRYGPTGGTAAPGAPPGAADEQESNVELVLYGVVSLYERYPPRAGGAGNP